MNRGNPQEYAKSFFNLMTRFLSGTPFKLYGHPKLEFDIIIMILTHQLVYAFEVLTLFSVPND